jgi:nucleoid-associated protein YgaU
MKKDILWQMGTMFFILILSGCAARTYKVVKMRVDQDLTTGNKGYIMGAAAQATQEKERKATRATYVTEIEMPTFAKSPKASKPAATEEATQEEPYVATAQKSVKTLQKPAGNFKEYKVLKGDTLQKISKNFYGTTKKWTKIYEANKDKLSAPDKIYPGQIINIPVENVKK